MQESARQESSRVRGALTRGARRRQSYDAALALDPANAAFREARAALAMKATLTPPCIFPSWFSVRSAQGGVRMISNVCAQARAATADERDAAASAAVAQAHRAAVAAAEAEAAAAKVGRVVLGRVGSNSQAWRALHPSCANKTG
jgi:hypothetical protein